jgi:cellulose synthase/poly-beta-1,6-N-acetylglucosamine synthase-like glycosyltransferase
MISLVDSVREEPLQGDAVKYGRNFSEIAGPVVPESDLPSYGYQVQFKRLHATHGRPYASRSALVAALNILFEAAFFVWLLQPARLPRLVESPAVAAANIFVIASIAVMEFLRLVNVISMSLASVVARDPVPVAPRQGERVAFVTTIVPSKEPIDMVRRTLIAALRIDYDGQLDVWLLDEGDDPAVKAMCAELGVWHFSRKGRPEYNQKRGPFRAKTKHGNYNSWLREHGSPYSVLMSVDPDHVPLPNYAERILGYFRDPDVAYVAAPQCYANCDNFITKAAESQQFPFHSVIQRAANRYGVAMLVGTNNAIRIAALNAVGGWSDSVTEDMATGLKLHTRRNPATGERWRSVYTPDVLAVGEGPSTWSDYFSQQLRWSRGTFDLLLGEFWRRAARLSPGRIMHYALIAAFYPSMAIGWLLGAVNAVLYLVFGAKGIKVPPAAWLALYVDATAFQMWLYVRHRRYNVSPYETEGSTGICGMVLSVLASPMYASSLIAALLRRPAKFVVTAKGTSSSQDTVVTFRRHLQWAVLLAGALIAAVVLGYATPAACLWPAVSLLVCLLPSLLWWSHTHRHPEPLTTDPTGAPQPARSLSTVGNHQGASV